MSHDFVKSCARKVGMYRALRWSYRHLLNRSELKALREELAFYAPLVRPGGLCFDIGANYGVKSDIFLRLGAKVVAFEPQVDCLQELRARIGRHPRLVTVKAAVGETEGRAILFVDSHRTASSLVSGWHGKTEDRAEVPVTTLDLAIAQYGVPDHCKIDVEGYELNVLKGLTRPIPSLSFEYHLVDDGPARALACLDYLSKFGTLSVNVAPAETAGFARPTWWTYSEFVPYFHSEIPSKSGYGYGDIFVKIQS